jgi:hypothetical protein
MTTKSFRYAYHRFLFLNTHLGGQRLPVHADDRRPIKLADRSRPPPNIRATHSSRDSRLKKTGLEARSYSSSLIKSWAPVYYPDKGFVQASVIVSSSRSFPGGLVQSPEPNRRIVTHLSTIQNDQEQLFYGWARLDLDLYRSDSMNRPKSANLAPILTRICFQRGLLGARSPCCYRCQRLVDVERLLAGKKGK